VVAATGCWLVELRDATKHPGVHRECPSPNISSVIVEEILYPTSGAVAILWT
jgi:hypothetical protein